MTDHDLIQEAREHWWPDEAVTMIHKLADALEAAVARADELEQALREIVEGRIERARAALAAVRTP